MVAPEGSPVLPLPELPPPAEGDVLCGATLGGDSEVVVGVTVAGGAVPVVGTGAYVAPASG